MLNTEPYVVFALAGPSPREIKGKEKSRPRQTSLHMFPELGWTGVAAELLSKKAVARTNPEKMPEWELAFVVTGIQGSGEAGVIHEAISQNRKYPFSLTQETKRKMAEETKKGKHVEVDYTTWFIQPAKQHRVFRYCSAAIAAVSHPSSMRPETSPPYRVYVAPWVWMEVEPHRKLNAIKERKWVELLKLSTLNPIPSAEPRVPKRSLELQEQSRARQTAKRRRCAEILAASASSGEVESS